MTPLIDPDLTSPDHRILITGGVRSGKSRYGETLLADSAEVTYVATGPVPDPATIERGGRHTGAPSRAVTWPVCWAAYRGRS
jgi:adenosyl cobinamide kinase/adenosyl cobinamide phosphate guanylyltransferase